MLPALRRCDTFIGIPSAFKWYYEQSCLVRVHRTFLPPFPLRGTLRALPHRSADPRSRLARLGRRGLRTRIAPDLAPATLAREAANCVAVITRNGGFPAEAVVAAPRLR